MSLDWEINFLYLVSCILYLVSRSVPVTGCPLIGVSPSQGVPSPHRSVPVTGCPLIGVSLSQGVPSSECPLIGVSPITGCPRHRVSTHRSVH